MLVISCFFLAFFSKYVNDDVVKSGDGFWAKKWSDGDNCYTSNPLPEDKEFTNVT